MKKYIFLPFIAAAMMASCSSDNNNDPYAEGEGCIRIGASVDLELGQETRATPTDVFDDYYVFITGKTIRTMKFPENKLIEKLNFGSHTIRIASHEKMPVPQFDVQYYEGSSDGYVTAGEPATVPIQATQRNAGVFFEFSEELKNYDIIPTVEHTDEPYSDYPLVYSGENKDACGYFPRGVVKVTLSHDGVILTMNGKEFVEYSLAAQKIYKVKVNGNAPGLDPDSGHLKFNITLEPEESMFDVTNTYTVD